MRPQQPVDKSIENPVGSRLSETPLDRKARLPTYEETMRRRSLKGSEDSASVALIEASRQRVRLVICLLELNSMENVWEKTVRWLIGLIERFGLIKLSCFQVSEALRRARQQQAPLQSPTVTPSTPRLPVPTGVVTESRFVTARRKTLGSETDYHVWHSLLDLPQSQTTLIMYSYI